MAEPLKMAEVRAHLDGIVAELALVRTQNEELFAQLRAQESSQTLEGQPKMPFKTLYLALNKARRIMHLFTNLIDNNNQQQESQPAEMEDISLGSKRKRTE